MQCGQLCGRRRDPQEGRPFTKLLVVPTFGARHSRYETQFRTRESDEEFHVLRMPIAANCGTSDGNVPRFVGNNLRRCTAWCCLPDRSLSGSVGGLKLAIGRAEVLSIVSVLMGLQLRCIYRSTKMDSVNRNHKRSSTPFWHRRKKTISRSRQLYARGTSIYERRALQVVNCT